MALASEAELLMFVAGEPKTTPSVRESGAGAMARVSGMVLGAGVLPAAEWKAGGAERFNPDKYQAPPLTDTRPWHLPPQQMICLDIVLDVAKQQNKRVTVIDVDRALDRQALVDRWVGPNDVLPLLVRSDGARLGGAENFRAAKVRRFVRGT